jgi:hypothetical protein
MSFECHEGEYCPSSPRLTYLLSFIFDLWQLPATEAGMNLSLSAV